ncbi:pyridine nucleotide-disulfide oxidoreductase family protein [Firmicutes bacterium CAG:240]|nr:pyridine nucleotide-disulfide oxidoreductase family protein [Firmicutes bacterium CAG:240]
MAREKIIALGKKMTDRIPYKLGLEKLTESDPEYYGLECVVTDDEADVALAMDLRKPTTPEKIAKKMGKPVSYVQKIMDDLSAKGVLEYNYDTPDGSRQYVLPIFVPGAAELMNMNLEQVEKYPQIAKFFERMAFLPLTKITPMVPPGGNGIGMHVIPVEKAIPATNESVSIEHISHWLKKYEGQLGVGYCSCRNAMRLMGEGCGEMQDELCIAVGTFARYCVETGKGRYITHEEALRILKRSEENGYVHQITNIDGENKIFAICNCALGSCFALRTSQLFNTPNMSASAYRAHVDKEKCVACGKCVEVCPAGAAKLGQKLCTKDGPVVYPKQPLPDDNHWGEHMWDMDYKNNNQKNCHESGTAPCKAACPAHIAVQGYIKMAGQGRYLDALKLIKQDNPFPAVCGSICNRRCEDACTRGQLDRAVAIDEIKKFIAEKELSEKTRYIPEKRRHKTPDTDYVEKIAIIGAGPAGMSCAYYLAEMGYANVTVFDRNPVPGGMLTLGIPSFRLERKVINAEIDVLKKMGIKFKCGVEVGKDITIDELRKQGYKGFFVAIGAQKSAKLGITGEELKGVYGGVDFLRDVNLGNKVEIGKKVAVIGGGNVAMDVVRTAVRLGAEEAYIVYRRSEDEMPADKEEVAEAMAEGVKFCYLNAPVEITGTAAGKVNGLKVEIMELGEPDEKGRRKPVGTGKFETIAVSSVIAAIGQVVDWGTLDVGALETTKKGTAIADGLTYQTAQPDIFVGGDCYTGPKFAIDAIAAGKEAAISLHRYVHPGQTLTMGRDRRVYKALDKEHALLDISHFDHGKRQMPGYNEAKAKTFADARVTFTEEQVRKETARCLGCGATKVDEYLCIGCGLCTTKCKFDAIHLKKVRDWHAGTFETMPIKVAEGLVKRAGGLVKNAVKK